jgi:hypothetical protein
MRHLGHFTPGKGIQYPLDRKLGGRILCATEIYFDCLLSVTSPFKTTFSVPFKNAVLTSQKMQYLSSTKTSWLMLFRKM